METLRLVLLGPPASGKGTQGHLMTERWHVPVTSIGEMLRNETAAGTPLGVEAGSYTQGGSLVPDRIALEVVERWLAGHDGSFVFDGFPRTIGQAEALEQLLARRHAPLTAVLWLDLDRESIEDRVKLRLVCAECGRTFRVGWQIKDTDTVCPACHGKLVRRQDDDPETLAHRMNVYAEHTAPLIDFYESRGLLRRINASGEADAVFAQIEAAVHTQISPA